MKVLASDDMEGRGTGTVGYEKAAAYVVSEFRRAGLQPAFGTDFKQPVRFNTRKIVESDSSLELIRNGTPERLTLGDDAIVALGVDPAASIEAPLVFVGYGLTVPEEGFDDLAAQDLKGKIIVTLPGGPPNIPGPLVAHYRTAAEREKFLQKAGVVGTVQIQNPRTADLPWARTSLQRLNEAMSLAQPDLVDNRSLRIGVTVNAARADKWLVGTGHTINELLDLVDAKKPLPHFPLTVTLRARVHVEHRSVESPNVAGIWRGSDPMLRDEYVVLSAHLDHNGLGQPIDGDRIYNGAMDNASGVAALIEVARSLKASATPLRRSVLVVAVSGEEKGLLGSRYFVAHPPVDRRTMIADINADMFLPIYPFKVATVYGLGESTLADAVRQTAASMHIDVQDDPAPQRSVFTRSDQYNWIRRGVPALMVAIGNRKGSPEEAAEKAWLAKRYHAPSDDVSQPVDMQAAGDYVEFLTRLATTVANARTRPHWNSNSFFKRFEE